MGSSEAAGYVTPAGALTSRLDELAFTPIDYAPDAPVDEWSGDRGCGVQYLSQQAAGRLLAPAGIEADPGTSLPERLVLLQQLMAAGDPRAARVYETIGTYLGYALLEYRELYEFDHLLLLGRVMTGAGGDTITGRARRGPGRGSGRRRIADLPCRPGAREAARPGGGGREPARDPTLTTGAAVAGPRQCRASIPIRDRAA